MLIIVVIKKRNLTFNICIVSKHRLCLEKNIIFLLWKCFYKYHSCYIYYTIRWER